MADLVNLIEYIESTKTWTCPQSGIWKVTCVGGGASGGIVEGTSNIGICQAAGGSTSFGSYLSASGGAALTLVISESDNRFVGGEGGYDLLNYGGAGYIQRGSNMFIQLTDNGGSFFELTGKGWGAGGGNRNFTSYANPTFKSSNSDNISVTFYNFGGSRGELKTTILKLDKDQSIPCTVGKGGKATTAITATTLVNAAKKKDSSISSVSSYRAGDLAATQKYITDGKDGVIILQYLGTEV